MKYVKIRQKQCTKCLLVKEEEHFHIDKKKLDGLFSSCKICRKGQYEKTKKLVYKM